MITAGSALRSVGAKKSVLQFLPVRRIGYVSVVFATATWLAGRLHVCLSHDGIVSKRLNLS